MTIKNLRSWVSARLRGLPLVVLGLALMVLARPAQADWYQYTFTSDVFNVHSVTYRVPGDNERDLPGQLRVEFYTWTPLTGPATTADIISYKMTLWGGGPANLDSLTWPLVPDGCQIPGGCYTNDSRFSIGALDANGLPTQWDIFLSRDFLVSGFSETFQIASTQQGGSLFRDAYSYYTHEGSYASAQNSLGGVWTVALVPEPGTYALMLVGLVGLVAVGAAARPPQPSSRGSRWRGRPLIERPGGGPAGSVQQRRPQQTQLGAGVASGLSEASWASLAGRS